MESLSVWSETVKSSSDLSTVTSYDCLLCNFLLPDSRLAALTFVVLMRFDTLCFLASERLSYDPFFGWVAILLSNYLFSCLVLVCLLTIDLILPSLKELRALALLPISPVTCLFRLKDEDTTFAKPSADYSELEISLIAIEDNGGFMPTPSQSASLYDF